MQHFDIPSMEPSRVERASIDEILGHQDLERVIGMIDATDGDVGEFTHTGDTESDNAGEELFMRLVANPELLAAARNKLAGRK